MTTSQYVPLHQVKTLGGPIVTASGTTALRQRDGLPENATYTDTGCNLLPRCQSCWLPKCRYEMPPGRARALVLAARLAVLLADGRTRAAAAAELGISRRSTYRLHWLMADLAVRPAAVDADSCPVQPRQGPVKASVHQNTPLSRRGAV
jgi:hypothetical protein